MGGSCVIAATHDVKRKGVKTGMRLRDAMKLCPEAIARDALFRDTGLASEQIEGILDSHCPLLEQLSIDEWKADLRACIGGTPKDLQGWSRTVQQDILRRAGLPVSIGIAGSSLLAKMASDASKPLGVLAIEPTIAAAEAFLRKCKPGDIPGIGWRRAPKVEELGWGTAWDVAIADTRTIVHLFGRPGIEFQDELRGIAHAGIVTDPEPPKSISRCRSFPRTHRWSLVEAYFFTHLSRCVWKLRRHGLQCKRLNIWVRMPVHVHRGCDAKLPSPIDTEEEMLPTLRALGKYLYEHTKGAPWNQAGLCLSDLTECAPEQYSLLRDPKESDKAERLQKGLDAVRARYGRKSILRGSAALISKTERKPIVPTSFGDIQECR